MTVPDEILNDSVCSLSCSDDDDMISSYDPYDDDDTPSGYGDMYDSLDTDSVFGDD